MAKQHEIQPWETKLYAAPALATIRERGEISLADLALELNADERRHILATLAALEKNKVCKLGKKEGRFSLK